MLPFRVESLVLSTPHNESPHNVREPHGQLDDALHVDYRIRGLQQLPSSVLAVEALLDLVAQFYVEYLRPELEGCDATRSSGTCHVGDKFRFTKLSVPDAVRVYSF